MRCLICASNDVSIVYKNFPGFIDKEEFDVFECSNCNAQFIDTERLDTKIYDLIYSNKDTYGYDRYLKYAENIKKQSNPLLYLLKEELMYCPVVEFIKGKKRLDILEIGCGYGYLSYGLHDAGHTVTGIDISQEAVGFAKKNFGDYFYVSELKDYNAGKKFDLIVATELIEHVSDPVEFIALCNDLLKDNGKIIVTTPNRDYFKKTSVWQTDLPPVHTVWFSKKSFRYIAKKYKLDLNFFDFKRYTALNDNKLITFFVSRKDALPLPLLNSDGTPNQKKTQNYHSLFRKVLKYIAFSPIINTTCSFIESMLTKENPTLGVIFSKNNKL